MPLFRRSLSILLAAVVVAAGIVFGVVRFVVPHGAPKAIARPAPATAGLTQHLAFIVVDGLRHDVATDPALMPLFAERMRAHASGEMWAGPVSMTSSAILTYATGQRGGLDQIINNETGSAVAYDNVVDSARRQGLITVGTGDHAWFFMFRDAWSRARPDPDGVAITVDYNHETFDAAFSALRDARRPNFLVVHFVTPDHQAHAYGVLSERYRQHIHAFDEKLDTFLSVLPADTTVILTSDHGATDTGTHGSDTPVQRRSPFVAWGPGIVAHAPSSAPLDQIDLASTFAALLGVPAPAHGRGHVLSDWLAVSDEERARIACADLDRLSTYARTAVPSVEAIVGDACSTGDARARIGRAASAARALDDAMGSSHLGGRAFAWLVPVLALLATAALALATIGRRTFPLAAVPLTAIALFLTLVVERLPWHWPTIARVSLYVAGNALVLFAVLRAERVATWIDRRAVLAAVIVPGLLVVTPSRTTQIESFVLASVIGLFAIAGVLPATSPASRAPRATIAWGIVLCACLWPFALIENFGLPKLVTQSPFLAAAASLIVLGVERATRERKDRALVAIAVLVAVASLHLRRVAPPAVCLSAWLGLPLVAAWVFASGRRAVAELLLCASYAWVSRDFDVPVLVTVVLLASAFGHALARRVGDGPPRPFVVTMTVTLLFSLVYLVRIGLENGIDFMQLDWGAGAFRDPGASVARIGFALVWKHAFAIAALLWAALSPLPAPLRVSAARGLVAAEAMRAGFLAVVLSTCGESFWTALRVIGDLPHPLVALVVAAVALVTVTWEPATRSVALAEPA